MPILFSICLSLCVISCAKTKKLANDRPSNYLPSEPEGSELKMSSNIRTFSADSLWVYIDGGAEEFLKHNFIEVSSADYKAGPVEIVVDIYSFKSYSDAKAMFVTLKPENFNTGHAGDDGFILSGDYEFIRG